MSQGTHPRPSYRITLDGRDITPLIEPRLIDLTLTDARGIEADQLDITLDDADGALEIPPRGARLRLALGWHGAPLVDKGDFVVDDIEHRGAPDKLILRGRSADLRATLTTKREQSWHGTTAGAIVTAIAARNGLEPAIAPGLAGEPIAHLDQTDESDINLLDRLARECGAIAAIKSGRLCFMPAGAGTTASGLPLPAALITRSAGDSHAFAVADRDAYTGVRAYWHDTRKGQKDDVVVGGDEAAPTPATTEPSAGNVKTLRHTYATKANAVRAAKAEWLRLQRGVAEFSITMALGRPELMPEMPVRVQGWKPQIDAAEWLISRVTHRLGDGGLTTALELEVLARDLK